MTTNGILHIIILLPLLSGTLAMLFSRSFRASFLIMIGGVLSTSVLAWLTAMRVRTEGTLFASEGLFFLDALSAYHLFILTLVYSLCSLYSWIYFRHETFPVRLRIQFTGLWSAALSAMLFVLLSNNIALMWVGIEGTTLLTAFLICLHTTRASLEATWKYLIICSVGVALAFIGILLVAASANGLHLDIQNMLLWTHLQKNAEQLHPSFLKAAFIFLLIGYGTKAGLAPMHTWLPDAHSQAPSPVSALFSGFLLNASLYCVMRFLPVLERNTGYSGWSLSLMAFIGAFSIVIASAFILFQTNLKRLLAYSSVEHLGIMALGLGLGGLGTSAALFHTLNHSVCKSLAFFSAGRLGQRRGTHDIDGLAGSIHRSRLWGIALLVSLLTLIGTAPFSIFMSEFQLVRTALLSRKWLLLIIFFIGTTVVFMGALRQALFLAWGEPKTREQGPSHAAAVHFRWIEYCLVVFCILFLVLLGFWMPTPLRDAIQHAASVIQGVPS